MSSAVITFNGHILDSLLLPKVLDLIVAAGADYVIDDISIGRTKADLSSARITISAENDDVLAELLKNAEQHGAVVVQT